jgi:hypothetical protein
VKVVVIEENRDALPIATTTTKPAAIKKRVGTILVVGMDRVSAIGWSIGWFL